MRVLHLTAGSDAGGLSRYIFDLCSAMHARGDSVAVAGERGAWHWLFEKAPWPWIDVPLKGGPIALWKASQTLEKYLEEHPVDIFHTHYRRATLVARRLQTRFNVPIVYTSHLSGISLNWPMRKFTDFGDIAHAPSEEVRDWLRDEGHVPADRIALIPHGIDPAKFPLADDAAKPAARQALDLPPEARVAAYVGRLDFPKNQEWMLDLAAASRDAIPGLVVLIAGEGPHEPHLRDRIARENLGPRVRLLGHRDALPIYQAADAVLLPSMREGFSLVCTEAMSVGRPVLRCRTAGTQGMVIENVTGRSVPIDRDAFVRAAIDLLRDDDAMKSMGLAAARHVREHFTFDKQFSATMNLYNRVAKSMSPSPSVRGPRRGRSE